MLGSAREIDGRSLSTSHQVKRVTCACFCFRAVAHQTRLWVLAHTRKGGISAINDEKSEVVATLGMLETGAKDTKDSNANDRCAFLMSQRVRPLDLNPAICTAISFVNDGTAISVVGNEQARIKQTLTSHKQPLGTFSVLRCYVIFDESSAASQF